MIDLNSTIDPKTLERKLDRFWELSAAKIQSIDKEYDLSKGSPVFTINGKYTTRGWTEWTQGFQFGSSILQFDATGDEYFLNKGRKATLDRMAAHISHTGVHDHGFNNLSTYGNLLRLMNEEKIPFDAWEKNFYELAIKISGAVQASRWTSINGGGFIYSFNGPHSLFVDTLRSCRILMLSHLLGHELQGEGDERISLLERAVRHITATAKYSVFYGRGRDSYDVRGRTAHESIFNTNDGNFRCPNTQQGYSGFSTWTRGLAWAMLGFAEELECFNEMATELKRVSETTIGLMLEAAKATCDFYIENTPVCGIPYWDTGAPNLHRLGDYLERAAEPFNDWEPVDSSAAAIACQGLMRLGWYLHKKGFGKEGEKYRNAGLKVFSSLMEEPYLSSDPNHQGLILHSIYHQPNGWDHVPEGKKIACGESSMWGDYHAREAALYVQRILKKKPYYSFYNCVNNSEKPQYA